MPISPLPQSVFHALGSAIDITSPCSLVKELVENAIDAKATAIDVLVSSNTIDKIQVRDNGTGIDISDFDALGRRSHTSKLVKFDEVPLIGGSSLGFRGQALASINTLASVEITTRTRSDPIASRLKLKTGVGGVYDRKPMSSPIGTTVQVLNLFEKVHVRRHFTLKQKNKIVSEIDHLLKSIVLARPSLKLSFKVVGSPKYTWSYTPLLESSNVREAALQLFGIELSSNCIEVSEVEANLEAEQIQFPIVFQAFLPRVGCDPQAIKSKGLYVSIDSRPIASTTKLAKKLQSYLKNSLATILDSNGDLATIPSPFLQVDIRCPRGFYDINVTPLKDDVVFSDEERIFQGFQNLCLKLYRANITTTELATDCNEVVRSSANSNPNSSHSHTRNLRDTIVNLNISRYSEKPQSLSAESDKDPLPELDHSQHCIIQSSSSLSPDKILESPVTQSQLDDTSILGSSRTKAIVSRSVNMSRTDSNTTDQGDWVEVHIAPLAEHSEDRIPRTGPAANSKRSNTFGIEKYFSSQACQDFRIMEDDTATPTERQSTTKLQYAAKSSERDRTALRGLSDSDINKIQPEDSDLPIDEGQHARMSDNQTLGSSTENSSSPPASTNILRLDSNNITGIFPGRVPGLEMMRSPDSRTQSLRSSTRDSLNMSPDETTPPSSVQPFEELVSPFTRRGHGPNQVGIGTRPAANNRNTDAISNRILNLWQARRQTQNQPWAARNNVSANRQLASGAAQRRMPQIRDLASFRTPPLSSPDNGLRRSSEGVRGGGITEADLDDVALESTLR